MEYRHLAKGEIVQEGDETGTARNTGRLREGMLMTQKLDIVEFAVHQLEQSLLTLTIFGGASTVKHLAELHTRIVEDWDEQSASAARAVECIMEAINVDNNGKVMEP